MTLESDIQRQIMLAIGGRPDTRLWRNNTAVAWAGDTAERHGRDVLLTNARPIRSGLAVGSSDLIGIHRLTVLPEHVGRALGVFLALEVKSTRGRVSDDQRRFLACIEAFGGIGGVARSAAEAEAVLP